MALKELAGNRGSKMSEKCYQAGVAMALHHRYEAAVNEGYCYLAPIKNTLPGAQMMGVGRLTYRPRAAPSQERDIGTQTWRKPPRAGFVAIVNFDRKQNNRSRERREGCIKVIQRASMLFNAF